MKTKILYVEDEPFLGKIVKDTLELKNYEVLMKDDGARVLEAFFSFNPDICILDVMLPNVDGFTLGEQIRKRNALVPIIFLTAKSQTDDVLNGFKSGGTDYLRKPFSIEELIARVENQLHLLKTKSENLIPKPNFEAVQIGNIRFFPDRFELHNSLQTIKLSHREAQILNLFFTAQNQTIDRKEMLLSVWGDDSFFNSRNLDVYIRKIREYLSPEPKIEIITLKGKGYHFLIK